MKKFFAAFIISFMSVIAWAVELSDGWLYAGEQNGAHTFMNTSNSKVITFSQTKIPADGASESSLAIELTKAAANSLPCEGEPEISGYPGNAEITCKMKGTETQIRMTVIVTSGDLQLVVYMNGADEQDLAKIMKDFK